MIRRFRLRPNATIFELKALHAEHIPYPERLGSVSSAQRDDSVIPSDCGKVNMSRLRAHRRAATLRSNNTGEFTAIGEVFCWIQSQTYEEANSYEICSDSYYGSDAVPILPDTDCQHANSTEFIFSGLVAPSNTLGTRFILSSTK